MRQVGADIGGAFTTAGKVLEPALNVAMTPNYAAGGLLESLTRNTDPLQAIRAAIQEHRGLGETAGQVFGGPVRGPIARAIGGSADVLMPGPAELTALHGAVPALGMAIPFLKGFKRPAIPPEDFALLKGTKVADVSPKVVFHGTSAAFDKMESGKASAYGLYGPGFYFTESPRTASGYAGKTVETNVNPNVRMARLAIKNPMDMDAPADPNFYALWQRISGRGTSLHSPTNGSVFQAIRRELDRPGAPQAVVKSVRDLGYDGMTHIGGKVSGGRPHRVWIAFDPQQILPASSRVEPYAEAPKTALDILRSERGSLPIESGPPRKPPQLAVVGGGRRAMMTGPEVPQRFNVEKLSKDPAIQATLKTTLRSLGLETRKTQTMQDLIASAAAGNKGPAEDIARSAAAIHENNQLMKSIAAQMESPTLTADAKAELLRQMDEAHHRIEQAINVRVPAGSDYGRAVNAFKLEAADNLSPVYWFTQAQRMLGPERFTTKIATDINGLIQRQDRLGLARYMASLKRPTLTQFAVKQVKAAMLSNPASHLANIVGNTAMYHLEKLSRIPATVLDRAIPGAQTQFPSGLGTVLKNELASFPGAWQKIGQEYKYGRSELGKVDFGAAEGLPKLPLGLNAAPGAEPVMKAMDFVSNAIFRTLGAEDVLAREPAYARSLTEQAMIAAKQKGLSGNRFWQEVKNLTAKPTPRMSEVADADAAFATFNNSNVVADAINRASQGLAKAAPLGHAGLELTVPFRRTPTNVIARALDYSPVGFLKTAMVDAPHYLKAANVPEGALRKKFLVEGLGRNITGTGLFLLGWVAYQNKRMIPGPSSQQDVREIQTLKHQAPYSVSLGGHNVSISRASPAGMIFEAGAAAAQARTEGKASDIPAAVGASAAQQALQMPWLQQTASVIDALRQGGPAAQRALAGYATAPIPAVAGAVARGVAGEKKRPESLTESIQGKIPFLANRLQPELDALGRPIPTPEGGVPGQLLSPFPASRVDTTLAVRVLDAAGWSPSDEKSVKLKIGAKGGTHESLLRGSARTAFERERGAARQAGLNMVGGLKEFWDAPPEMKKKIVRHVAAAADASVERRWRIMLTLQEAKK